MIKDFAKSEFGDFVLGDVDLSLLGEGWTDSSWRNDACPSVSNEALGLKVYIDHLDPEERESPEFEDRFALFGTSGSCIDCGNSWSSIVETVKTFRADNAYDETDPENIYGLPSVRQSIEEDRK